MKKKLFLMVALVLCAAGAFADTYYRSEAAFYKDWDWAANKYSYVHIAALQEEGEGGGTFACDGDEEDGYLAFYYDGKDGLLVACFSDKKQEYFDSMVMQGVWFNLPSQYAKAKNYWNASMEAVK